MIRFFDRVPSNLSVVGRMVLALGALTFAVLPAQSQEPPPRPLIVGMDPEVARDLVVVLGDDFGRVAGLPLKLATDPHGKRVFLPETSGIVSVYDTQSLRCIQKWPLHNERCLEVAIVDQGRKLVSISMDGNARLWDIAGAAPSRLDELKLAAKTGWVTMSPSRSGERIVLRTDEALWVAEIRDGRIGVRKRLAKSDFPNGKMPFEYTLSPDGHWMVTCETHSTSTNIQGEDQRMSFSWFDSTFVLWDVDRDEPARVFGFDGKSAEGLTFSADSKHLFAEDPFFVLDGKMHEWLIENEKLVPVADLDNGRASIGTNLIFSSNGRLRAQKKGQTLSITSILEKEPVSKRVIDAGERLLSATFIGDDILLVAGSLLQRWDWRGGKYQQRKLPSGHHSLVRGLHFDSETGSLVSASSDSSLEWKLKELSKGQSVSFEQLPWKGVTKMHSNPDHKGFAFLYRAGEVETLMGVTRTASGNFDEQYSIEMTKGSEFANCWCFAVHPTEQIVATGHHNNMIFLWDVSSGKPAMLTYWKGHEGHVCNLAFSPDGDQIASVGWDRNTILWEIDQVEARAGKTPIRHQLGSHKDIVRSVAWSLDGNYLASGGEDGQILLWEIDGPHVYEPVSLVDPNVGQPDKNRLSPPTVNSLSFSRNGAHLLSADGKGTVSIWSVKTKTQVKKWQLPGWVWDAQYSPDESTIAIANNDGTIYMLRAPKSE